MFFDAPFLVMVLLLLIAKVWRSRPFQKVKHLPKNVSFPSWVFAVTSFIKRYRQKIGFFFLFSIFFFFWILITAALVKGRRRGGGQNGDSVGEFVDSPPPTRPPFILNRDGNSFVSHHFSYNPSLFQRKKKINITRRNSRRRQSALLLCERKHYCRASGTAFGSWENHFEERDE